MRVLPRSVALSIASFLGACFSLIAKRRFTAERNIRYALGISLNDHQIQSVARGAYQSLFITLCELLLMRRWSNQSIHNMISYNDEQMIREYLNDKRGVIFVTGHYGNWELMSAFAGVLRYPLMVLVKPLKHPMLERYLNSIRSARGARVVYRGAQMRELFKTLRLGGAVGIVADQDAGPSGVLVPLFGKLAYCPSGIARMARVTNSRIVPIFLRREKIGRYRVIVCPEIQVDDHSDSTLADVAIMSSFCRELEQEVGLHPDQWLWQHKRWKSSPEKTILKVSDGKLGHAKQTDVMTQALALKLEAKGLKPQVRILVVEPRDNRKGTFCQTSLAHLSRWYAPAVKLAAKMTYSAKTYNALNREVVDYVVSCGASTEIANRFLKLRNHSRNCFIQSPQYGSHHFDAVVFPAYDKQTHPGKGIKSPGPLVCPKTPLDPSSTLHSVDQPQQVLLLVGGHSRHMKWVDAIFDTLLQTIIYETCSRGWRLNISTSRRTMSVVEQAIQQVVHNSKFRSEVSMIFANQSNPSGLYDQYLQGAARIIVTADSLSMIAEALSVSSDVALLGLEPKDNLGKKVRSFSETMNLPILETPTEVCTFLSKPPIIDQNIYLQRVNSTLSIACERMTA